MGADRKKYDSTIARMAGNIAAGLLGDASRVYTEAEIAQIAVRLARLIVDETQQTEIPAVVPVQES